MKKKRDLKIVKKYERKVTYCSEFDFEKQSSQDFVENIVSYVKNSYPDQISLLTASLNKIPKSYSSSLEFCALKNFDVIKNLGEGSFGRVIKAKHRIDEVQYAIKKIVLANLKELDSSISEVKILARLNHINIVRYFNCWVSIEPNELMKKLKAKDSDEEKSQDDLENEDGSFTFFLYIQMELCDMALDQWLMDRNKMFTNNSDDEIKISAYTKRPLKWILDQIARGVKYLHDLSVIHRDLKPSNILISISPKPIIECDCIEQCYHKLVFKIGDFGLSKNLDSFYQKDNEILFDELNQERIHLNRRHTANVGSSIYMAPEIFSTRRKTAYTEIADMYSLGVIFLEIIHPTQTTSELINIINDLSEKLSVLPEEITRNWILESHIIQNLLIDDFKVRYSSREVVDILRVSGSEILTLADTTKDIEVVLKQRFEEIALENAELRRQLKENKSAQN